MHHWELTQTQHREKSTGKDTKDIFYDFNYAVYTNVYIF